jgi:nitrous oxidase accessory protein
MFYRCFYWLFPLLLGMLGPVHAAQFIASPGESLQLLIDRAEAGDEILLPAGRYDGGLRIHTSIHLTGQTGAVIDGGGQGHAVSVQAPDVVLRGLRIENWGRNLTELESGIFVEPTASNILIENNSLHGAGFGIWIDAAHGSLIRGNRIEGIAEVRSQDRGNGVQLFNARDARVIDNDILQVRDGIYIGNTSQSLLRGNRLSDLRYGVHYMYSYGNRVEYNDTTRTRTGYALMQSKQLTVIGNRSELDQNYGILMNNITNSVLQGNVVDAVQQGHADHSDVHISGAEGKALFVYNSQFNEFSGNRFAGSNIGIHLTAGSEDNKIFANAFIGNYTQVKYVATRQQEWSHEGLGNYWSDYLGWDLNGDGLGDVPYEPNDAIDQLLWRHPAAKVVMHSPAIQTLRWVQRQFPVFRPQGVRDSYPMMVEPPAAEGTE